MKHYTSDNRWQSIVKPRCISSVMVSLTAPWLKHGTRAHTAIVQRQGVQRGARDPAFANDFRMSHTLPSFLHLLKDCMETDARFPNTKWQVDFPKRFYNTATDCFSWSHKERHPVGDHSLLYLLVSVVNVWKIVFMYDSVLYSVACINDKESDSTESNVHDRGKCWLKVIIWFHEYVVVMSTAIPD